MYIYVQIVMDLNVDVIILSGTSIAATSLTMVQQFAKARHLHTCNSTPRLSFNKGAVKRAPLKRARS